MPYPDWLAVRFCTADWTARYGARVDTWHLPPSRAERDRLLTGYAAPYA